MVPCGTVNQDIISTLIKNLNLFQKPMRPNLFDYATSELSQDAFLLWFLRWSDPKYKDEDFSLHLCSRLFVNRLLGYDGSLEVFTIKVEKQVKHIDVFCIVNDEYAIIIEDKTNTSEHGRQMTRYSKEIETSAKYKHLQKHCIYFKTGNESQQSIDIIRNNYIKAHDGVWHFAVMQRQDMIEVLNNYSGTNVILLDYRDRITKIENTFLNYRNLPVYEWSWGTWQGFYKEMETLMDKSEDFWWGTVNSVRGAFVCAAWHRREFKNGRKIKLQIEGYAAPRKESRLCIKLEAPYEDERDKMSLLRSYGRELIAAAKERKLPLTKPKRYSSKGDVLTLACNEIGSIISENFSISEILKNLQQYQTLIDDFTSRHSDI